VHLHVGSNISVPACCCREKEGHSEWATRAWIKQVGGVFFFHYTVYTRNKERYQTQPDNLYSIFCMCLTQMIQVPRIAENNLCVHWR